MKQLCGEKINAALNTEILKTLNRLNSLSLMPQTIPACN